MLSNLRIKKGTHGLREIFCVVDGRKVPPFMVYPDAFKQFPDKVSFEQYIERSARAILESSEGARRRGGVAA
jgi:hypothetical protein